MDIVVGSTNKAKVDAVAEVLKEYPHLSHAALRAVKTDSKVSDQPLSLDETVRGALNRARSAQAGADLGIGLESGLMAVPYSKSGYMDVCVCALFDGSEHHLGLSPGWEFPDKRVMEMIVQGKLDMSQAVNHAGLTADPAIGAAEGAVGILTKGRVDRKAYTKEALRMALIHLEPADAA